MLRRAAKMYKDTVTVFGFLGFLFKRLRIISGSQVLKTNKMNQHFLTPEQIRIRLEMSLNIRQI